MQSRLHQPPNPSWGRKGVRRRAAMVTRARGAGPPCAPRRPAAGTLAPRMRRWVGRAAGWDAPMRSKDVLSGSFFLKAASSEPLDLRRGINRKFVNLCKRTIPHRPHASRSPLGRHDSSTCSHIHMSLGDAARRQRPTVMTTARRLNVTAPTGELQRLRSRLCG